MAHGFRSSGELSRCSFERILLIKPSSLGDVIHALPVLHGLRRRYPKARIDWLIGTAFAELLAGHEEVDELILFDRQRFGRIAGDVSAAGEFFRFVRTLRAKDYDLAIDLQGLFRSGFLTWMTCAETRVGPREAREGAAMFYTDYLPVEDAGVHAVDRNYAVGSLLGFADVPVSFSLPRSDSARRHVRDLLREAGVESGSVVVAIAPGARWETKVWPQKQFAQTVDALQTDRRVRCVLLGGKDEVALCSGIAELCRSTPIDLSGQTDLPSLAAAVELADVVLCQDSGVMHLAVALERPQACLIGPTNPSRTGPYRRLNDVIRLELDCAPCYLRRLAQCPNNHRCMKELTVDTVVEAVRRRLDIAAGHNV